MMKTYHFQTSHETIVRTDGVSMGMPNISIELTIPQRIEGLELFRTELQALFAEILSNCK